MPTYKKLDLKKLRQKKGYSQQNVADRLGITRQQYDKYEKKKHRPTVENMRKLAQAFDQKLVSIVMYFYE